jgi:hypothetical protein
MKTKDETSHTLKINGVDSVCKLILSVWQEDTLVEQLQGLPIKWELHELKTGCTTMSGCIKNK